MTEWDLKKYLKLVLNIAFNILNKLTQWVNHLINHGGRKSKRIVYRTILSSFTHPQVVPNLYEILSSCWRQNIFRRMWVNKLLLVAFDFHSMKEKTMEVDGYQQLFGSDSYRFGVNSPFNFPKCSNFPQSLNDCVRLIPLLFDYVEHIWISIESNLISNSIPILHPVGPGQFNSNWHAWIKMECIFKLTVVPNPFKTFQKYGNVFFFHRHSRNESYFGLLSLLVIHRNRTWTKGLFNISLIWLTSERTQFVVWRFDLFNYRLPVCV